jgi:hypothetical protein
MKLRILLAFVFCLAGIFIALGGIGVLSTAFAQGIGTKTIAPL